MITKEKIKEIQNHPHIKKLKKRRLYSKWLRNYLDDNCNDVSTIGIKKVDIDTLLLRNFNDVISDSFVWSTSNEGHDFWAKIWIKEWVD